ncbi:hypothetical protein MUY21_10295 [Aliiroseovarius sp. S2029]|nr:hypothetical protein [Aliiroseovarius sp. S2029]
MKTAFVIGLVSTNPYKGFAMASTAILEIFYRLGKALRNNQKAMAGLLQ